MCYHSLRVEEEKERTTGPQTRTHGEMDGCPDSSSASIISAPLDDAAGDPYLGE